MVLLYNCPSFFSTVAPLLATLCCMTTPLERPHNPVQSSPTERCRILLSAAKVAFILGAIILPSLFTEFGTEDFIPLNDEQSEGHLQHQARELRVSGGKATFLRSPHSVTAPRRDGGVVSLKPEEFDEKRYQFKNRAATHKGDDAVAVGNIQNAGDKDVSQDKDENGAEVLDEVHEKSHNPQATRNINNPSRNASKEEVSTFDVAPVTPV